LAIDDKPTNVISYQLSQKSNDAKNASGIGDIFVIDKFIVLTFLDFPNPEKAHQPSIIIDLFTSFVNVYSSHVFPMPKGIGYLRNFV
jgi:hypothetical protein